MMLESKEYPRVKKNSKSRSPNVRKPSNTDKNEETEVDGEDHAPRELMKTGLRGMKRILTQNAISQLRDSPDHSSSNHLPDRHEIRRRSSRSELALFRANSPAFTRRPIIKTFK